MEMNFIPILHTELQGAAVGSWHFQRLHERDEWQVHLSGAQPKRIHWASSASIKDMLSQSHTQRMISTAIAADSTATRNWVLVASVGTRDSVLDFHGRHEFWCSGGDN